MNVLRAPLPVIHTRTGPGPRRVPAVRLLQESRKQRRLSGASVWEGAMALSRGNRDGRSVHLSLPSK